MWLESDLISEEYGHGALLVILVHEGEEGGVHRYSVSNSLSFCAQFVKCECVHQAVVCWRLRWGSGHMMWCPGTSLLKTALSRALHPPCIQMCHQAGYALAFTQSQALMSSIQPFTFTKKSGVTILLGSMLPLTVVLYTKLASNKQVVAFRRIAN